MLARADDLARLMVLDEHGAPVVLGSLWHDRTAVLAFVRHFGCVHCRDHVAHLQGALADIRAGGAELHVVGNGSPSFIAGFREDTGLTSPVYTDPSLAVYRAAQLRRGVLSVLDLRGAAKAVRALAHGHRQTLRAQGDQLQQGGVVVIARDGTVVWQHVSRYAGDNANPRQILWALAATTRP